MSNKVYRVLSSTSVFILLIGCAFLFFSGQVLSHGVDESTKKFLLENQGAAVFPFLYIGAKHMLTGYDHLLFLVGVVFFLFKNKDIIIYVSLFTLGHSTTLFLGVFTDLQINAYLIDAIIGFSVVYKGFDNLGGWKSLLGFQPNTRIAVIIFGLFHDLGLATKLQEFQIPEDGLITNIISFNVGVEIGQIMALVFVVLLLRVWRTNQSYIKLSVVTNTLLMSAGILLMLFQLTSYAVINIG